MFFVVQNADRFAEKSNNGNRRNLNEKDVSQKGRAMIVVILDLEESLFSSAMDIDTATTLIALVSEDPCSWDDALASWARYQSSAVCEFPSSLSFQTVEPELALEALGQTEDWVLLDFRANRILTGRAVMAIGRDQSFAMVVDELGDQHSPLSVHLPPWWELHENVDASAIDEPRQKPIDRPHVNRDVLFGEPLLNDLAQRILSTVHSDAWSASDADSNERTRYDFTINVHRDWLMTPREDLGGRMPRQLLHGARSWIDRVVWSQRIRFEDGAQLVAAPDNVAGYETAPMGSEEMVIYFDLCRELIQAGWFWCTSGQTQQVGNEKSERHLVLVDFLRDARDDWMRSPFEGGSPPSFIVECSRRQVPRGSGVPIVGITQQQTEQHIIDCDCPICNMMADGMFGIGFTSLDGHHLDLDDEFAFSMYETQEEWQEMIQEYEEFSANIKRKQDSVEAEEVSQPDEFESAWSGIGSDEPMPGDPLGHVKLAFLLAEVVSVLHIVDAPTVSIRELNDSFTEYRTSASNEFVESASRLKNILQSLSKHHPELISKAADLQSRIDEQLRSQNLPK